MVSDQEHAHRQQASSERVEDQAEAFERRGAQEGLITFLTEDHRGGASFTGQLEVGIAHLSRDRAPEQGSVAAAIESWLGGLAFSSTYRTSLIGYTEPVRRCTLRGGRRSKEGRWRR